MIKKSLFFITLFLLLCGYTTTSFAGSQDFILENQTGIGIRELYIAPYQSDDWEKKLLNGAVLADGESLEVTLDGRSETYWDIMIRTDDGNEVFWRKFNLKEISKVTLYFDGKEVSYEYE